MCYFYTAFTRIKHSARHWGMTIILEKSLSLSKVMTWCTLSAVWVVNLFWKAAGGAEVCLETWWIFPRSGMWQPWGNTTEPSPAGSRARASTAENIRAPPRLHPDAFCSVSCSCVAWRGKAKGRRLTGPQPPRPIQLVILSSSDQDFDGNCICLFHIAFQGFPRGSQKPEQDLQPQVMLASLHKDSVTDDGTWPLPSD